MRPKLAGFCALLALFCATPAQGAVRTFALVLGVNTSVDPGVESLSFADDDAAKYARLFDRLADQTILLTVLDSDSRQLYGDLAARARVPDRAGLDHALAQLRAAAVREHAAGNEVVVYFVFVGHGARDKDGEGYVSLTDQRLSRTELHRVLIAPPADPGERFDTLHVIIDACSAYFVVHERGTGVSPAPEDYSGRMSELFGPPPAEKAPHVGFLLATTGDVKVHEWSAWRGGVFSHLVRSGLSGAADVDLDGKVTYAELGGFIAAASGSIQDPRARLEVTVTPPPAQVNAPLSDRAAFKPRQLVYLEPALAGHYAVETEAGERIVDLHKARGQPSVVAVWGAGRYYLTGAEGETLLDFSKQTALAAVAFVSPRRTERGAIDEEYRRALFSRPFDYSFYRAYCALLRLPAPDAPTRVAWSDDLARVAGGAPSGAVAQAEASRAPMKPWGIALTAAGGAALAAGVATAVLASSSLSDERTAQTRNDPVAWDSAHSAFTLRRTAAWVLLPAGAAMAATGVALLIVESTSKSGAVALAPTVAPDRAGLVVSGSF
jgi:hypothetical protein